VLALARTRWKKAGLVPITLQESRHTAATWLDAAGVPPKIASVLMGHATPARQAGAALGARPFDGRPSARDLRLISSR